MDSELEKSALLDPIAAAKQLGGISHWTLRKHIARGSVAATRIGRRVFVREEEIRRIKDEGLPKLTLR